MDSLKTRTITAISFGIIIILSTLLSNLSSLIFYTLLSVLMLNEYFDITLSNETKRINFLIRKYTYLLISIIPIIAFISFKVGFLTDYTKLSPLLIIYFVPYYIELRDYNSKPFQNIGFLLNAHLYIILPTIILIHLSVKGIDGRFLIMAIMLLIWANDVFAYLGGKYFGKNKIFPIISPNKTKEGLIFGFLCTLIWGIVSYFLWYYLNFELYEWIIISIFVSIGAIVGDLIESLLKRSLKLKDTGNILPGHGGFIDRMDAFYFTIPLIFYLIIFVLNAKQYL